MKRSEMRKKIAKILRSTVGGDAAKSLAEDILYEVEKAGMMPPWLTQEGPAAEEYDVYAWEPEDETN